MNLIDVHTLFPTDEKCREMLTRLRWPEGVQCPRCKMPAVELETEKTLYYCKDCDYQFTVMAGTIFNDSHLPLTKWFLATLLLCEAKKGISACQVQRHLGVNYRTAWHLCHRIKAAMLDGGGLLGGMVEADETYIGPRRPRKGRPYVKKDRKEVVLGMIECMF